MTERHSILLLFKHASVLRQRLKGCDSYLEVKCSNVKIIDHCYYSFKSYPST